jgi:hypothetical protein
VCHADVGSVCCYSAKSLWLLDYGAVGGSWEWVDHLKPAARGGKATIENGLCASWIYNKLHRDNQARMPLFVGGKPTLDFLTYFGRIPDAVAKHLQRFSTLVPSVVS